MKWNGQPAVVNNGTASGIIDAEAIHPDGKVLVRISDHWWFLDDVSVRS